MQPAPPWLRVLSACSPARLALPGYSRREHRRDGVRHVLDLVVAERRIARDRQRLGPEPVGLRKPLEAPCMMGRTEHGPAGGHTMFAERLCDGGGIAVEAEHETLIH